MTRHLTGLCIFLLASLSQAADLQGVGMFQTLDKPWFLVALYTERQEADEPQAQAEKLELKVVEDKISVRRYRQLWKDVFAVAQNRDVWQTYAGDLNNFFELIKGPLKANDQLVIEATGDATVVSINYREHARPVAGFPAAGGGHPDGPYCADSGTAGRSARHSAGRPQPHAAAADGQRRADVGAHQ